MVMRKDLVDIGDINYHERQGEYLNCRNCGYAFGGTRGDYFLFDMDDILSCAYCGSQDLAIVRDVTTQFIVKQ